MVKITHMLAALTIATSPAISAELPAQVGNASAVNSYEVLRNGKRIGTHEIRFERYGNALKVVAETNMKVKFLFITAYKYRYVSEELWVGGELQQVETRVNDNGKELFSSATRNGDGYKVARTDGGDVVPPAFMTTNHWNDAAPRFSQLFNTITGKINDVTFTPVTTGDISTAPQLTADAKAFSVRGELNINTFYDSSGNWLGMVFEHKDGSTIEFRCVDCKNMPEIPA